MFGYFRWNYFSDCTYVVQNFGQSKVGQERPMVEYADIRQMKASKSVPTELFITVDAHYASVQLKS